MRKKSWITAALALVLVPVAVLAHDLFIKLDTYFLEPDAKVTIPILNGTFRESENAITPDRVLDVSVVRGRERSVLGTSGWHADEDSNTTYLKMETGAAGTVVIGASTKHRDFELSAEDFNDYLEHDGIPDVLEARRLDGELGEDVAERYGKHIKAIVQVGEERSAGWDTVLGYPAEIVPLTNPYELEAGDMLEVRCLVDGEPVANQLVIAGGLTKDGAIEERSSRTDKGGKVGFVLREPGRWYVKFIHMAELEADPAIDYESKWATLSFEAR